MADLLAKEASEKRFIGPEPAITISIHTVHEAIRQWARKSHRDRWRRMTECTQARQVLDEPKGRNRETCCRLSRRELYLLTQMVTGHSTPKGHLHKMGLSGDATCDYCGYEVEDRNHFVCRCEAFCTKRLAILGSAFVEPKDLVEFPLRLILEFTKKSERLEKVTQAS